MESFVGAYLAIEQLRIIWEVFAPIKVTQKIKKKNTNEKYIFFIFLSILSLPFLHTEIVNDYLLYVCVFSLFTIDDKNCLSAYAVYPLSLLTVALLSVPLKFVI